jgi:tRNA/tmRNA/rRNA uracil-C5-methylase (TrmA/RlmC/RlmD family)
VTIETVGDQGDGIAKVERGYVVIVPETQPGEQPRSRSMTSGRTSRLRASLPPTSERADPPRPYENESIRPDVST